MKQGNGRRANVTASLQGRQPAKDHGVRNEAAVEGIGAKLARGGKQLMNGIDKVLMPTHLYQSVHP